MNIDYTRLAIETQERAEAMYAQARAIYQQHLNALARGDESGARRNAANADMQQEIAHREFQRVWDYRREIGL